MSVPDAYESIYESVGSIYTQTPNAYFPLYENVSNTAAYVAGRLLIVVPNVGVEDDDVEIRALGLGTTQGARTSQVFINNIEMPVQSWTNVAAVGAPSLNMETGATTFEYQLIQVKVPPGAISGIITVHADDGT